MGICDRQCRLCFSVALWNERDTILKERIFGLTGAEGNHGEDPKECYYYLDSTPTHSYMKALYKYPQAEFPYGQLVEENRRRGNTEPEFELEDTGVFDEGRYWDVYAEYAKASPMDILIRLTVANRGPEAARLHLVPTLWYRNTWIWGCKHEGCTKKPLMKEVGEGHVRGKHETLGISHFYAGPGPDGEQPPLLWTENENNSKTLYGVENYTSYTKDAFHRLVRPYCHYPSNHLFLTPLSPPLPFPSSLVPHPSYPPLSLSFPPSPATSSRERKMLSAPTHGGQRWPRTTSSMSLRGKRGASV